MPERKNKHRKEKRIWKPLRESKQCWTPTMKLLSTDLSFSSKQEGAWLWKPWRRSKSCLPNTTKPFGTDLSEETGFLKGVLLWRPWRELKLCCPSTTKPSSIDFRLRGYIWQMMKLNPRLLKWSKRREYFSMPTHSFTPAVPGAYLKHNPKMPERAPTK